MEKEYPLISVIIPVYNVEKYLRRCVDSVLAQTYPNVEIILVNDGSPDNSQAICEEYARTQPSVRALKKPNGGLSSARNFGLNSALGKYVGFVDSDDWIAPDMYMHLYNLIKENDADAAQINLMLASSEDVKVSQSNEDPLVICGRDNILEYYLNTGTHQSGGFSVCRCLFGTYTARKYRFREGKINEDIDWKYKVLSDCNKFVVSNRICYFYFQSGDSTTTGSMKKRDFDLFDAADELYKLTQKENNPRIRFYGEVKRARTPFSLLCRIAYFGIDRNAGDKKQIIKELMKQHRKYLKTLLKAPLPLSRKILSIALAINYNLVGLPFKLIRR